MKDGGKRKCESQQKEEVRIKQNREKRQRMVLVKIKGIRENVPSVSTANSTTWGSAQGVCFKCGSPYHLRDKRPILIRDRASRSKGQWIPIQQSTTPGKARDNGEGPSKTTRRKDVKPPLVQLWKGDVGWSPTDAIPYPFKIRREMPEHQGMIRAHSDSIPDIGVLYDTYSNLFTIKIHHNGEFSKPHDRWYKFVVLDYDDLVDSDMFSLYELFGRLNELGLGDNNQILFIYFRISWIYLDDGLVSLMADSDVIKLLNFVPGCKEIEVYIETSVSLVELHLVESLIVSQSHNKCVGNVVVIDEIIEDNVVSSSGKDSRFLMIEWPEDEHVDTSYHASTMNVYPIVKPMNDENVGYLDCDNEHAGDIHKIVQETLMDDDLFQQDSALDYQQDPYHVIDEEQEIAKIVADQNHPCEEEFGLDVLDFSELPNGDECDDEQDPQARKRILHEIIREILAVKSRKAIQIVKCDNLRVTTKCFGNVVGYKKTNKDPMESCTHMRDSDNPSTLNNNGSVAKGRAKCDILVNNLCESLNSKLVGGRDQTIIGCLEYIRE
ncbi:hypothetical protein Tco_0848066 [Tanacetum coccineum]